MDTKSFTAKYYVKRKNTDCIKWDNKEVGNRLPMFIADMDFKCDDKVLNPLIKRIKHGSFGYTFLPKDYYEVMINWNKKRNNVIYKKDWIRFSKGAVDGLFQLVHAYTKPNDAILITTPVYPPFSGTIKTSKRKLITSSLIRKDGLFTFNYKDIEEKLKTKKVKMMILCSPHNPLGRVWTKNELEELFKLTHKYHVLVISDEVHSDLIMPGNKFIPSLAFKKYQNEIVTVTALSKTFSLAIFAHCHIVIPSKKLRDIFDSYQKENHLASVNAFNAYPSYYAYKYSNSWLNDVNKVIYENYEYMSKRLSKYGIRFEKLQGTYLVFVDFGMYTHNAYKFLYEECDIVPNDGGTFGKGYESYARINLATSLSNIKLACKKIEKAINK